MLAPTIKKRNSSHSLNHMDKLKFLVHKKEIKILEKPFHHLLLTYLYTIEYR